MLGNYYKTDYLAVLSPGEIKKKKKTSPEQSTHTALWCRSQVKQAYITSEKECFPDYD